MNVFNRKQTNKQNTKKSQRIVRTENDVKVQNEEKPVTNLGKDICENVQRKCGRQRGIANQ